MNLRSSHLKFMTRKSGAPGRKEPHISLHEFFLHVLSGKTACVTAGNCSCLPWYIWCLVLVPRERIDPVFGYYGIGFLLNPIRYGLEAVSSGFDVIKIMYTSKKNNGVYETCQYSITLFLFYKTILL